MSDGLRFQYLKPHNKGPKREKVECFHFPIIPQLKYIQQIPLKKKNLTTKLKTGETPENCYLHNHHLLSTFYKPSISQGITNI